MAADFEDFGQLQTALECPMFSETNGKEIGELGDGDADDEEMYADLSRQDPSARPFTGATRVSQTRIGKPCPSTRPSRRAMAKSICTLDSWVRPLITRKSQKTPSRSMGC